MCGKCPFGGMLIHDCKLPSGFQKISEDLTTVQCSKEPQKLLKIIVVSILN